MFIRIYVYLHVLTIALTGLVAYWDRVGPPARLLLPLMYVGLFSVYLLPVFPIACLSLVGMTADRHDRLFVVVVGCLATVAHMTAALPLVQ